MRAVHGHIGFHECADEVAFFAHPRLLRIPEEAMMHEQQIGLLRGGHAHSGEAGIHGSGDAADFAVVLHLQPVQRAIVIGDRVDAQGAVAMFDNVLQ